MTSHSSDDGISLHADIDTHTAMLETLIVQTQNQGVSSWNPEDSPYVENDEHEISLDAPPDFPTIVPCPGSGKDDPEGWILRSLLNLLPPKATKVVRKLAKNLGLSPTLRAMQNSGSSAPNPVTAYRGIPRGALRSSSFTKAAQQIAPPADFGLGADIKAQWHKFCHCGGWQVAMQAGICSAASAFAFTLLQPFLDHFFQGYPRVQQAIKTAFKVIGIAGLAVLVILIIVGLCSGVGIVPLFAGIICSVIGAGIGVLAGKLIIWLCRKLLPEGFKDACTFKRLVGLFSRDDDDDDDDGDDDDGDDDDDEEEDAGGDNAGGDHIAIDIPIQEHPTSQSLERLPLGDHTCGSEFGPFLFTGSCAGSDCSNAASIALEHDEIERNNLPRTAHFVYCQTCWEITYKEMFFAGTLLHCACGASLKPRFVPIQTTGPNGFAICPNRRCLRVGICVDCTLEMEPDEQKPKSTATRNPRTNRWVVQHCMDHLPRGKDACHLKPIEVFAQQ